MGLTTIKYKIISPVGVRIKGVQTDDIIGLHLILKKEGCADRENLFTDNQKALALDNIQVRRAKIHKTNVEPSADILLCVNKNLIFLSEAKFRVENVKNISKREIDDKIFYSKYLIEDENYNVVPSFYLLFSSAILTQAHINELKRTFLSSPKYQFVTAVEFYNMFDCK